MTLTELIAALEAATEGSEAMDIAITELFHPVGERGSYTPYTRSLDAALTLVPEGWTVGGIRQSDNKCWTAELREGFATSYNRVVIAPDKFPTKATPALALSVAALKARQS